MTDAAIPSLDSVRGSLRQAEVAGTTYGYHRFGSGSDLVLFNGDAMCMSMWTDTLLSTLAQSFTVTIFDYPGMGQSSAAPGQSWLVPDMATQSFGFLAALGLEKPHVLGWSTGGEIVLQMAVQDSAALGGVVSVAGDPGSAHFVGDPDVMTKIAKATPQEMLAMMFPADQKAALDAFVTDLMSRPQDFPSQEVLAAQDAAWNAWLAGGIWDDLPAVSARCLLLNGADDELVPAANAQNMADRIPGAQLEIVPDAGHAVLLQEPVHCAQVIGAFLDET